MPTSLHEHATVMFADQMEREELTLMDEADELHIIADDWTLVIQGDPAISVMIALDDESGDPAEVLEAAISADELASLKALDAAVSGSISTLLAASPVPLARSLSNLVRA